MGTFKKNILALVFMFVAGFCFAQQISFQILQHDETSEAVTEQSYTVEDQLIEMFFENGYIVTNSPTVAVNSNSEAAKLWKAGLKEAKEGYSNFFIQINLYYTAESLSPKGEATLKKADWTLVYTKTGEPKAKNTIKSKQSLDVKNDLYLISADIFDEIKKAIKA